MEWGFLNESRLEALPKSTSQAEFLSSYQIRHRKAAKRSNEEIANTDVVPFDSYTDIEAHFTQDETRRLWRELTTIEGIGSTRATNLILRSRATELIDLRNNIDDEQWEYIENSLDAAPEPDDAEIETSDNKDG